MNNESLVPAAKLRELCRPNYIWPMGYLIFDWSAILGLAWLSQTYQNPLLYVISAILIGGRQHALFVLIHEAVHKHLARKKTLNDFIGTWFAALPLMFDLHFYRDNHFKHHEHLNTDQDPDWIRKRGRKEWAFPVSKLALLGYLPYYVFIRGPIEWSMIVLAFSGILQADLLKNPTQKKRFIIKSCFYLASATSITLLHGWIAVTKYWLIPLFFVFPLLQRIRSIAEHFALEWTNPYNSSREVLSNWVERTVLCPHFVNYHLCHHLYPAVPCYRTKELFAELRLNPIYDQEAHINASYLGFEDSVLSDILRMRPQNATSPTSKAELEQRDQLKAS